MLDNGNVSAAVTVRKLSRRRGVMCSSPTRSVGTAMPTPLPTDNAVRRCSRERSSFRQRLRTPSSAPLRRVNLSEPNAGRLLLEALKAEGLCILTTAENVRLARERSSIVSACYESCQRFFELPIEEKALHGIATGPGQQHGYMSYLDDDEGCLLYTSPSPRDRQKSRMPSSA